MLFADFFNGLLNILFPLLGVFLILLVLIQRGRGGGLAGAFGGMGGSSAFGTRAGDMFTKITLGVAGVWIVMAMFLTWYQQEPEMTVRPGMQSVDSTGITGTEPPVEENNEEPVPVEE